MLKKTKKERNRKKTIDKRVSKNNKKHTFRRKNTKNLTKKNKMLGGHFCIFETQTGSRYYGCDVCAESEYKYTTPSRYFYYHGNGDTLFGFNSHLFKHLDNTEILRNNLNNNYINFVKTHHNSVLFSLDYNKYPILKEFIDEIKRIINVNKLTYESLKKMYPFDNGNNMFTSGPFTAKDDSVYPELMITWSKKTRLPNKNPPSPITGKPYTKFVQLHSLYYNGRSKVPVCTQKNDQYSSMDNDVSNDQKQNFLPTKEQYKNEPLTQEVIHIPVTNDVRGSKQQERKNENEQAELVIQAEKEEKWITEINENIEKTLFFIQSIKQIDRSFPRIDEIEFTTNIKNTDKDKNIKDNLKKNIDEIFVYLKNNGLNIDDRDIKNDIKTIKKNIIKDNNEFINLTFNNLNKYLEQSLEQSLEQRYIAIQKKASDTQSNSTDLTNAENNVTNLTNAENNVKELTNAENNVRELTNAENNVTHLTKATKAKKKKKPSNKDRQNIREKINNGDDLNEDEEQIATDYGLWSI